MLRVAMDPTLQVLIAHMCSGRAPMKGHSGTAGRRPLTSCMLSWDTADCRCLPQQHDENKKVRTIVHTAMDPALHMLTPHNVRFRDQFYAVDEGKQPVKESFSTPECALYLLHVSAAAAVYLYLLLQVSVAAPI